jgi:hypothetical protein
MRRHFWVLLLVGMTGCSFQPAEPSANGKKLSEWVAVLGDGYSGNPAAVKAIRQMGTNALPWLLYELQYEVSPGRFAVTVMQGKTTAYDRNRRAAEAFKVLGTNAAPAIPAMIKTIQTSRGYSSPVEKITEVLPYLGTSAVPAWRELLKHGNAHKRGVAAAYLGSLGPAGKDAFGDLLKALKDDSLPVRVEAAGALGAIGEQPERVVPLLMVQLKNAPQEFYAVAKKQADERTPVVVRGPGGRGRMRSAGSVDWGRMAEVQAARFKAAAAYSLGEFGPRAKAALPLLEAELRVAREQQGAAMFGATGRDDYPATLKAAIGKIRGKSAAL